MSLLERVKKYAPKYLPHIIAAGSGTVELDLAKATLGPLIEGSLTVKLKSPVPNMMLTAAKRWWRQRKLEASTILRDEDRKADDIKDWILVDKEFEDEEEFVDFVGLTSELENTVTQGYYGTQPELLEFYVDEILGAADANTGEEKESADDAVEIAGGVGTGP